MAHPLTPHFVTTSVITLLICVFGLIGNVLCAAVLFNKRMTGQYRHLLQGLTISDTFLLTLSFLRTLDNLGVINLPVDPYFQTIVYFWDWISTSGTKYFTVAVSIERFFVITFPLKAHTVLTSERSRGLSCGVFCFCVLLSCFSYTYDNWIDPESFQIYAAIVLHFLPFALVVIFNILIFIGLRKLRNGLSIRKSSNTKDDDYYITRMLVAIMIIFGICYSFEFVRRTMNYLWPDYMSLEICGCDYYDYTINNLADIFYVLNSSVNFVVYCVLGRSFRAVFCQIFNIGKDSDTSKEKSMEESKSSSKSNNYSDSGNGSAYEESLEDYGDTASKDKGQQTTYAIKKM